MDLKNSMLLANMMSKKGGGTKTLNLVSVGGATYDSDYIFTNDGTEGLCFKTPEKISFQKSDIVDIKLRIKTTTDYVLSGFITLFRQISVAKKRAGSEENKVVLYITRDTTTWSDILANITNYNNQWLDCEIHKDINNLWSGKTFVDGTLINSFTGDTATNDTFNFEIFFGGGTTSFVSYPVEGWQHSFPYWLNGAIDFKRCDIIINGQSVLWV